MTTTEFPRSPEPGNGNNPGNAESTNKDGLLSLRSAVILFMAFVGAVVAGGLTYLVVFNVPLALLAALGAFGSVTYYAKKIIH